MLSLRILTIGLQKEIGGAFRGRAEGRGHSVWAGTGADNAFEYAIQMWPHVIVIDVDSGDNTGFVLARRLRLLPSCNSSELVAIAEATENAVKAAAKSAKVPFAYVLRKPLALSSLLGAVERAGARSASAA